MGCDTALLIPVGCYVVWMHPYVASLTIYLSNCCKKNVLLGTHISHVLSFLDLSLNSALQGSCTGSKGSMPMELFPAGLSSSSAICLYELRHCTVQSGGLVDWYVVLSLAVSLVHAVYILVIPFVVQVQ